MGRNIQVINLLNEGYSKPIFFEKGKGSRVYFKKKSLIDLSCGSGTLLLGHNSNIFTKSVRELLSKKYSNFSHPNTSAIKLSKNLKAFFPKFDKFVLCTTGAEANLKALRIARAATGKKIIINVSGSWHGSVDQLLFQSNKSNKLESLSAGLSDDIKKDIKHVPYNDIQNTKKILNKLKKKICCILIEPIQGGFPTNEGYDYLRFLNDYCKKNNLIFFIDEVLTGIRTNCSSVQQTYNLKSDLSTFGKIIGGGFPIGIIGISKKLTKKINKFKDKKIFFGGTFSGNSFSTNVGNQTLNFIKKNKKKIFSKLEADSHFIEKNLNKFILLNNIDAKLIRCNSILRIIFSKKNIKNRPQRDFFEKNKMKSKILFVKFLFENGVYFPNNGVITLSYSLTKNELKKTVSLIKIGLQKFFSF